MRFRGERMWAVRIGPRRSAMGMGRLPQLLAVLLVFGHGHIIGMASGPNPSFNHPPGVSTSSMGGPLSGTTAAFVDSVATGPSSPSADSTPSPSMRLRRPAQGIMVPDMYATFNEGFHAAKSPDVITLRSGTHQIGEHAIKGGQFHNNEPCYFEEEVLINKKLVVQGDITGTEKPVMLGKTILQQPVHTETWKPEEGGGTLQLMTLCHRDPGVHGFCVAIEGGSWLVEECEVRCTGEFSKAVWIYGGHYVFDDSYKGGGRVVDEYPGPDAVLRRSTIGGFCDSSVDGAAGWGILLWELASLALEDCLVEDCEFIGVSACHASIASVLGCTVQGCRVGGLLVNEEARMTVQSCLLRDNRAALVAGKEPLLAYMELMGNVVHGRVWHDSWGGQILEAEKEEKLGDGQPLFLGTWTDRGRIPDPDPTDVERYVRRVRRNTWSRAPVRLTRPDAEQMGLEPSKKVVSCVVGRPGNLVELHNEYIEGVEPDEDLVGIGVLLNVTDKGEVVVVGLLAGQPAQLGGVEVGDLIFSVDAAPVWFPEEVARRCAGEPGTSVTLGLLRGPYRGEIEITITRRFIAKMPLHGPNGCPFLYPYADISRGASLRLRESPSDEGERLADPGRSTVARGTVDAQEALPGAGLHQNAVSDLQTTQSHAVMRGNGRILNTATSLGVSTSGGARAQGVGEDMCLRGDAVEGDEAEGREGGGRILMADLQRDPWADPPPESDANPVFPERWGAGGSFRAGWGRASVGGAGIAERITMSGNEDEAPHHPAALGSDPTSWPVQGVQKSGGGGNRPHPIERMVIGPTIRPLSAAAAVDAGGAAERNSTSPHLYLSSRDGSSSGNVGDSSGTSGSNSNFQNIGADGDIARHALRTDPASAVMGVDTDGICDNQGDKPDSSAQFGNGHGDAQSTDDHERGSRERERRRARARAREAAAANSVSIDGAGSGADGEGDGGGDGVKGLDFGSPHSPPTPASS